MSQNTEQHNVIHFQVSDFVSGEVQGDCAIPKILVSSIAYSTIAYTPNSDGQSLHGCLHVILRHR